MPIRTNGSPRYLKQLLLTALMTLGSISGASAQLIPCHTFSISDASEPDAVRQYLARSDASFARVCGGEPHQNYFAASQAAKDGDICSYELYELQLVKGSLQRVSAQTQIYRQMANPKCPVPISAGYVATNDISPETFKEIAKLWSAATSSEASFDKAFSWIDSTTRSSARFGRFRYMALRSNKFHIVMNQIATIRNAGFFAKFRADFDDPEKKGEFFSLSISSWLGASYFISDFRTGVY